MNRITLIILFLCLITNTMPAASQQPAPAVPQSPDAAAAPAPAKQGAMRVPMQDRASFNVKITEKQARAGATSVPAGAPQTGNPPSPKVPANQPAEVEVTRFMPVQRNNVTWSNGVKTEDWISGKYLLKKSPDGNWINTFDTETDVLALASSAFTLRHFFSWVTPATYVEAGTRNGQPANRFRRSDGDEVWIHAESGLPIEFIEGNKVYTYTFGPLPTSAPELSPAHAKELARYLQTARAPKRISNKQ